MLNIIQLVEVERAGELLQVNDVWKVTVGEPDQTDGISAGGVLAGVLRQYLNTDVGVFGHHDEVLDLMTHHPVITGSAPQHDDFAHERSLPRCAYP